MIYVGTSGYSYKDWIGVFYPEGAKQRDMLEYYARHFPCVEINATYYSIFSEKVFAGRHEAISVWSRSFAIVPGRRTRRWSC